MRKGWEYKKLGEVCALTMGQSPDGNSINEVNGIEFHQGKHVLANVFSAFRLYIVMLQQNLPKPIVCYCV